MKYLTTFLKGIYAGLAIGLGSFCYVIVRYLIPSTKGTLLASCVFSIGLILVLCFKLFLYTGKIGVVFDNRDNIKQNAIDLPIMLIGNAVGAFSLGIVCYLIFYNATDVKDLIKTISLAKTNSSSMLFEGMMCGALVYIAVYLFNNLNNMAMKLIGVIVSVTMFVYCGFQHCIANMFYFGMAFNWNVDMIWNLLIIIVANSVGALLVRCFVHLAAVLSSPQ